MKIHTVLNILALMFVVQTVTAQEQAENWVLETQQPSYNSQHYQATKNIELLQGFGAMPYSGQTFKAEINPLLVIPEYNNNITGGSSDNNHGGAVGTIPVTINVNDYGASQIDIPIHLPPGIASMMPELSFAYNSQSGDGILGVGWSIGGLSKISLVPKSYYYNGYTGEVGFETNPQLYIDGNYLIKSSDGTYYTEQHDFSSIKAINQSDIRQGFIVQKANGLVYEYGATQNSRHVLQTLTHPVAWYLSKITDAFGNYLEYSYNVDAAKGSFSPDYIRYTGNIQANISPMYEIKFNYSNTLRTDTQKKYFADINTASGFFSQITQLLEKIEIKYLPDDDLIVKYFLSYSNGGVLSKKLLHYIEPVHYHSKSASNLNPITINWENSTYELSKKNVANDHSLLNFPINGIQKNIYGAHFKNKNTTDLVHFGVNTAGADDFLNIYENYSKKYENGLYYAFANPINYVIGDNDIRNIAIVDTDGDGIDEIAIVYKASNKTILSVVKVDLNNSPHFFEIFRNETLGGTWPLYSNDQIIFTDFNGDGITDVAYIDRTNNVLKNFLLSSVDDPFGTLISANIALGNIKHIFNGDFHGSGKNQLLTISSDITRIIYLNASNTLSIENVVNDFSIDGKYVIGDYNGDGKTDLLVLNNNNTLNWKFYLAKEKNAFTSPIVITNDTIAGESNELLAVDVNNDGFTDISFISFDYIEIDGYNYKRFFRTDFLVRADDQIKVIKKEMKDVNGNRIPIDEIRMHSNHWQHFHHCIGNFTGSSPNQIMFGRIYINPSQPDVPKLRATLTGPLYTPFLQAVSKITNGLGAISSFEYTPHSYQNYGSIKHGTNDKTVNYSYPLQKARTHFNVVSKLIKETSQDTYLSINYNFLNPVVHRLGKGLLGFEQTTAFNQFNATITQNEFNFINDYFFKQIILSKKYSTFEKRVSLVEQQEFLYSFRYFPDLDYKIFYPYIAEITKHFYEHGAMEVFKSEKIEMSMPDQFGNHEYMVHRFGKDKSFPYHISTTKTYDNFVNPNRRFLGLVKKEITEYQLTDEDNKIIRTIDYQNNASTGFRFNKTLEQGNSKALSETYTPDLFGNTIAIVQATENYNLRSTTTTYSTDGRFPVTVTNPLGHATTYNFNASNGRVQSITDPNGLQTHFNYDFFGELSKTVYPNNTQSLAIKRWVKADSPHPDEPQFGYPVYFVISKSSGQNKLTTFYDQENKPVREVSINYAGEKIYKDFLYYEKHEYATGLLYAESLPYIESQSKPAFIYHSYDPLRRKRKTIKPNGSYEEFIYNGLTVVIKQFDGQTKEITHTEAGLVDNIYENGTNKMHYQYYGDGKVHKTFPNGLESKAVVYSYDKLGNLSFLNDPSLGVIAYNYNAFGDLVFKSESGNNTIYNYDELSRLIARSCSDGKASFSYDSQQYGIGLPALATYIQRDGNHSITENYFYDSLGKLSELTQSIDGDDLSFKYNYDIYGRRKKIMYPSGLMLINRYDENGNLRYISDSSGNKLWQHNASDAFGNVSQYTLGQQFQIINDFNLYDGLIRSIEAYNDKPTNQILNLKYDWFANGNLMLREDRVNNLVEEFDYDTFNRLKTIKLNTGNPTIAASYLANGNFQSKIDAGTYQYNNSNKPYEVSAILPVQGSFPLNNQSIAYTSFNKVKSITEGDYSLNITYGPNHERVLQNKTGLTQNDRQQTRYFTPLYEVVDEDGIQKRIHYLSAPTGIFAIFTLDNKNQGSMQYVLKDHQGSLAALVNEKSGTEYFSFDAWGRRRNPSNWSYDNIPASFGSTRGFTMHEHLDEFKLINMNGRVYDPLVGRFISPDPFVQMPDYSQSYNRYSYAFNNPLRFSDPSGFFAEGDSTIRPTAELPFLPAKNKPSYRPKASTNTDNTSLGSGVKETETTLPIPYLQSKLSNDAEGNANEAAANSGGYTIDMQRIAESPNATVSEFTAYGPAPLKPVTGYILEPGGPSTTTANQDKRIPAGTYSIDPYSSKKYSNHYIVSNSSVSQDRRILIHSGNYHSNTLGCLLPGSSYSMVSGNYAVWNSGATLNSLRSLIGGNSATLYIYDINTTSTFNFSNW